MSTPLNFNTYLKRKPVVLIVPLDWGLGHATRCIPIISHLLHIGCKVIVGAEGAQKALILNEFPHINIVTINGYRLNYGKSGWHTRWKIMLQSSKILMRIKEEKKWLDQFLEQQPVDLIISDNRYGLYSKKVKSIFISHQLAIQTGMGSMADRLLQRLNYHFIEKFSACWIPDEAGENNLAGLLSHPKKFPALPLQYIGSLSRFKKGINDANCSDQTLNVHTSMKLLIILSGPEPQRSIFEKILLKELKHYHEPAIFVRGLPDEIDQKTDFNQVSFYNHLSAKSLHEKVNEADIIISRSGYSTVMDMIPLGKKCVFVATPGQSEQEYLAKYLQGKNLCVAVDQDKFSLRNAIEQVKLMNAPLIPDTFDSYQSALEELIQQLR